MPMPAEPFHHHAETLAVPHRGRAARRVAGDADLGEAVPDGRHLLQEVGGALVGPRGLLRITGDDEHLVDPQIGEVVDEPGQLV